MNDSAVSIEMLKNILVDLDFESVCPPLTEDEFSLLEQNIISDGEVTSPLIVWDNKLIDGHGDAEMPLFSRVFRSKYIRSTA